MIRCNLCFCYLFSTALVHLLSRTLLSYLLLCLYILVFSLYANAGSTGAEGLRRQSLHSLLYG